MAGATLHTHTRTRRLTKAPDIVHVVPMHGQPSEDALSGSYVA